MDNSSKYMASRILLSELFQQCLMDGNKRYSDICPCDKAYAASLYWDSMEINNEFEPLVEPLNSDRLISLVKNLLKGTEDKKEIGNSIVELIEDNAVDYLDQTLSDLFDAESRMYAFDLDLDGEIE